MYRLTIDTSGFLAKIELINLNIASGNPVTHLGDFHLKFS